MKNSTFEETKEHKSTEHRERDTEDNLSETNINSRVRMVLEDTPELKASQMEIAINGDMSKHQKHNFKGKLSKVVPEPFYRTKERRETPVIFSQKNVLPPIARSRASKRQLLSSYSSSDYEDSLLIDKSSALKRSKSQNIAVKDPDTKDQVDLPEDEDPILMFYKQKLPFDKLDVTKLESFSKRQFSMPHSSTTIGKKSTVSVNRLNFEFRTSSFRSPHNDE